MRHHSEVPSPDDTIVESFLQGHNVFVDILITHRHNTSPGHSFKPDMYVNGAGDVTCITLDECQLKFRLFWNAREFRSVMFCKGAHDACDDDGAPDQDRPALVVGLPGPSGTCVAKLANPPFHDVTREVTGQMVSVINDNPGGPGKNQYVYKLNVLATQRNGTTKLICIDPRIINK